MCFGQEGHSGRSDKMTAEKKKKSDGIDEDRNM